MLAVGPPIGPGPGLPRPHVCLGNADGTCPQVTHNDPFRGGHITRTHAAEMPWVQIELSRGPFLANAEKRARVLRALGAAVEEIGARTDT